MLIRQRIKIKEVEGIQTMRQPNKPEFYKQPFKVVNRPDHNPYGADDSKSVPYTVIINGENVQKFNIGTNHIGQTAIADLWFVPRIDNNVQVWVVYLAGIEFIK